MHQNQRHEKTHTPRTLLCADPHQIASFLRARFWQHSLHHVSAQHAYPKKKHGDERKKDAQSTREMDDAFDSCLSGRPSDKMPSTVSRLATIVTMSLPAQAHDVPSPFSQEATTFHIELGVSSPQVDAVLPLRTPMNSASLDARAKAPWAADTTKACHSSFTFSILFT